MKTDAEPAQDSLVSPQNTRIAASSDVRVPHSTHSVDLSIDQLVLDGLSGIDSGELGTAIQTELSRLLAERGLPGASAKDAISQAHAQVVGSASSLRADLSVGSIAEQLAETIYGRLKQ